MNKTITFLMAEHGYTQTEAEMVYKWMMTFGINNDKTATDFVELKNVKYHDPKMMKDMDKLVARLLKAIQNQEKVMFHGDYDTDGVTTTALFIKAMIRLGLQCDWYVPHRQKDGYGLHPRNVKRFEEEGYTLLVTGDTGIKEMETISKTTMDVIVTDHHEPVVGNTRKDLEKYEGFAEIVEHNGEFMAIPNCVAVVNPHRIDCSYPNKAVAGVTVIFKAMSALYQASNGDMNYLASLADLVAAGQIADMIEQIDRDSQDLEARKLVLAGMKQIESATSTWAYTFMKKINPPKKRAYYDVRRFDDAIEEAETKEEKARIEQEKRTYLSKTNEGKLTITDLGFTVGPFLNAPGRMAEADLSVEFLLEEDVNKSFELLLKIEKINTVRKQMKKEGHKEALEILANETDFSAVAVILPERHHSGYVGLIAGDLARDFDMPTLCFASKELDGKPVLTASCRSIEGVSILNILIEVEQTFGEYRYGGHQMAAGLTIDADRFDEFKAILNEVSKRHLENKSEGTMAIPVDKEMLTKRIEDFYIHMGAKDVFALETDGITVEKVTPNMVKLDLNGKSMWKFNFSPEEHELYKKLESTDKVKMEFTINKFDGENCWMVNTIQKTA